jgi:hypothetical protein
MQILGPATTTREAVNQERPVGWKDRAAATQDGEEIEHPDGEAFVLAKGDCTSPCGRYPLSARAEASMERSWSLLPKGRLFVACLLPLRAIWLKQNVPSY